MLIWTPSDVIAAAFVALLLLASLVLAIAEGVRRLFDFFPRLWSRLHG